jgi:hypothetical protein
MRKTENVLLREAGKSDETRTVTSLMQVAIVTATVTCPVVLFNHVFGDQQEVNEFECSNC